MTCSLAVPFSWNNACSSPYKGWNYLATPGRPGRRQGCNRQSCENRLRLFFAFGYRPGPVTRGNFCETQERAGRSRARFKFVTIRIRYFLEARISFFGNHFGAIDAEIPLFGRRLCRGATSAPGSGRASFSFTEVVNLGVLQAPPSKVLEGYRHPRWLFTYRDLINAPRAGLGLAFRECPAISPGGAFFAVAHIAADAQPTTSVRCHLL